MFIYEISVVARGGFYLKNRPCLFFLLKQYVDNILEMTGLRQDKFDIFNKSMFEDYFADCQRFREKCSYNQSAVIKR